MMDKKSITAVIACLMLLFVGQRVISKLFPPRPVARKPVPAVTRTNGTTPAASTAPAPPVRAAEPAPAVEEPRAAERTVTLENGFIRVEFTSLGGGIKLVEVLKHKVNGHGNVMLNSGALAPALALVNLPGAGTNAAYELQQLSASDVTMQTRTRDGIAVTKHISLGPDYVLRGNIQITGTNQSAQVVIGSASPLQPREPQQTTLGVDWLTNKYQHRSLDVVTKNAAKGLNREIVDARWVAVKNQFFTLLLTPATNTVAVDYEPVHPPLPAGWASNTPVQGVSAVLEMLPSSMADGVRTYEFAYYAGPKEYKRLASFGHGQEEVMQFGLWGPISVILLKTMNAIHAVVPNYGVAIILITIAIKIIFWPIQSKSIKSMKEMQKFQPAMQKLREKYKDEPQRLNQEMMRLYKEHHINPFAGCLPMLVQIPVFFALFAMLRSAVELRGAHFLWVRDLSQPDTILTLPVHLFSANGVAVNPLPLMMTASMIWQTKITPTTGDSQQAKMMMFMPLLMLVFFYNASSGLALYWTVQQLLSIGQQWWSLRKAETKSPPPTKPVVAGKTK
jgi:YidC/Oxa1 family membrane protein insertase